MKAAEFTEQFLAQLEARNPGQPEFLQAVRVVTSSVAQYVLDHPYLIKEKIMERNPEGKIAFSTTNFHVFRGCILARKCGFEAQGISAKTKLYFYLNAFLREFVGLLVDRLWQNLVCVLLTVLFFISLQLL